MLVIVLAALLACARPDPDPSAPLPPSAPGLVVEASLLEPLLGVGGMRTLAVETDVATTLTIVIEGDEGTRSLRWTREGTGHAVPLVGFRAGAGYTIAVTAETADGRSGAAEALDLVGDPLPIVDFPSLDSLVLDAARMAPGLTLFTTTRTDEPGAWALLVDGDLQPVWWAPLDLPLGDLRPTGSGTLIGLGGIQVEELDWTGAVLRRYRPLPVEAVDVALEVPFVHHEVAPLPDGGFLTLGQQARSVDEYPTSYAADAFAPAVVLDDVIAEVGADGRTVRELWIGDLLDVRRIGYNSLDPGLIGPGLDWAHVNAVSLGADGSYLVSARHQDAVFEIDPDGTLDWILGDPAGWTAPWSDALLAPVGDLRWPYHAHAPERHDDGTVLLFDNGNEGHTPYGPAPLAPIASRVVEFAVDEDARTVEQRWEFAPTVEGPLFAFALGDADRLSTGGVLAVFGMLTSEGGVTNLAAGRGHLSARIIEFDPVAGDELADLRVSSPDPTSEGWGVYRARRIESLHPDLVAQ
jgi:arylsulfate sulfotransferase